VVPRKALLQFLTVGIIWGTPYFFIAIAIEHFHTPSIVFARVFLGALILMPIALKRGMLKPTLKAWPAVLGFAVFEMVGPWFLITEAERQIPSSLAGLLITTVPFIAAFLVGLLGDRSAWHPLTVLGLILGLVGVVSLVGIDALSGTTPLTPVLMMLAAAVGYAVAPIIADRMPHEVPTLGVIAVSLTMVSAIYAPFAAVTLPRDIAQGPTWQAWASLLILGVVCSAAAFVIFFCSYPSDRARQGEPDHLCEPRGGSGIGRLLPGRTYNCGNFSGTPAGGGWKLSSEQAAPSHRSQR